MKNLTRSELCTSLISLVDVAERMVRAAKRRGAPNLSPTEKKVLDFWLAERDALERRAIDTTDETCPICEARKKLTPHKPTKTRKKT